MRFDRIRLPSADSLGLALSDRGILCARVRTAGGRPRVERLGYFDLPAGATWDQPEALGQAFGAFIKSHGLHAARAAIGVPARWLLTEEREVPKADAAQAAAVLRLQAERLAAAHGGELICDVPPFDSSSPTRVLLVGMLRQYADRIAKFCAAAGIKATVVTPTSMVLAQALGATANHPTVVVSRQGAEVVWQPGGAPRLLRHLSAEPGPVSGLAGELRRTLTLGTIGADVREMAVWNERGASAEETRTLSDRLGLPVSAAGSLESFRADVDPKALNGAAEQSTPEAFLPAVAVALAGASREVAIDFLRPKLAAPKISRVTPRARLIALAAVLVVVVVGGLYVAVLQAENEAALLDEHLRHTQTEIKAAQGRLERFNYGRGYFETRTPVLECLREVTLAFRNGDPIWTTGFSLRDNGKGQIQGRAENLRVVEALRDRLMANPRFADVQSQDTRQAPGAQGGYSFTISFTFKGGT